MSREENNKIIIYPITVGKLDCKYLTKIINECYSERLKITTRIPCVQLDNKKTCKPTYLNKNIEKIKDNFKKTDANISKENSIIVLITDKDSADLKMIQQLKDKFHSLFEEYEHTFFILNVKKLEYWLKYYFDDITEIDDKIKSHISRSINNKWDTCFESKHKNAKNKYNQETGHSTEESICNYMKTGKEYSDFPCFFYKLKKWFNIEM